MPHDDHDDAPASTAVLRYFAERMQDPRFAEAYQRERDRVDEIDRAVRARTAELESDRDNWRALAESREAAHIQAYREQPPSMTSTELIRASRDPELAIEEARTQGYREASALHRTEVEQLRARIAELERAALAAELPESKLTEQQRNDLGLTLRAFEEQGIDTTRPRCPRCDAHVHPGTPHTCVR